MHRACDGRTELASIAGAGGAEWRSYLARHPAQVKKRVRKGIPDALRGLAWQLLSGGRDLLLQNEGGLGGVGFRNFGCRNPTKRLISQAVICAHCIMYKSCINLLLSVGHTSQSGTVSIKLYPALIFFRLLL